MKQRSLWRIAIIAALAAIASLPSGCRQEPPTVVIKSETGETRTLPPTPPRPTAEAEQQKEQEAYARAMEQAGGPPP